MSIKLYLKKGAIYLYMFARWLVLSGLVGVICGLVGSLFRLSLDYAHHTFDSHHDLIYMLPVAGLFIVWIYRKLRMNHKDTNTILESLRSYDKIPIMMAPLIFISTFITHIYGGSSGKEGAALQMGGAIGSFIGRKLKLNKNEVKVLIMCGMSSLFSTFFLAPLTSSVFSIEVINVGTMYYGALLPCLFSSVVSIAIAKLFGLTTISFPGISVPELSFMNVGKVLVLAIVGALISVIFCMCMHYFHKGVKKIIPNPYFRVLCGGIIIMLLTILIGNYRYNGAGMDIISEALNGHALNIDFICKIIFTVITLGVGFKGGEILPSFFIGATYGNVFSNVLGLDNSFGASLGLITLFSAVVNCPITSIILSCEFFGAEGIIYYGLASVVGYMLSGYTSLYDSQKIMYSKLGMDKNKEKVNSEIEK